MGNETQLKSKNAVQKETASRTKSKKRDRSASEERLLQAAEDIFSKHGFKGATTRMIADKAKINESLIGRYFDGKMGLLLALIENHLKDHQTVELPYAPLPTVSEELRALVDYMFQQHCQKDEEFFKIVLGQCLVDAKFLKRIREIAPTKNFVPQVISRLKELQNKGRLHKEADVEQMIEIFNTYFHGAMFFDKILMGISIEEIQKKLHFFVEGCARSLEPQ
ncbi:TetR/AcrR family transcriptional regulator [Bdellovibrio sp. HCB290]|uniref:TetR/AcrR family transcriptional regulator n=1 Tax=Bdellovibrio sp. HCB290 TaxID=3394356 RepID=UPI0039B38072